MLICPVCKNELIRYGNSLKCQRGHSFDYSKDGYVNLLLTSKTGDKMGDSKESALARHQLLAKGYYSCLKDEISKKMQGTVLDICCGEGYYDTYNGTLYGFDISKQMVRLAAKSNKNGNYFVANLASIPIADESIDTAIHLFAPFNDKEFARILKPGGRLYSVIPGENHLWQIKQAVYDTPYKNDEKAPPTQRLNLVSRQRVKQNVAIPREDIKQLFAMTPYFYRTSNENKARLDSIESLDLTVDFVILEYEKNTK